MSKTKPTPKEVTTESLQKMVQEYIANGGEVKQCEPFARSEVVEYKRGFWGRPGKKKST